MTVEPFVRWIFSQTWHAAKRPPIDGLRPMFQFLPDGSITCYLWGAP